MSFYDNGAQIAHENSLQTKQSRSRNAHKRFCYAVFIVISWPNRFSPRSTLYKQIDPVLFLWYFARSAKYHKNNASNERSSSPKARTNAIALNKKIWHPTWVLEVLVSVNSVKQHAENGHRLNTLQYYVNFSYLNSDSRSSDSSFFHV